MKFVITFNRYMTSISCFEDLPIWQRSRVLSKKIRVLCRESVAAKDFVFVDQIRRAAKSVTANIAEGFESATNKEFIQFLGYAKRSAGEVRSHLYDALDDDYISMEHFKVLSQETIEIGKMIAGFIQYLQKQPYTRRSNS